MHSRTVAMSAAGSRRALCSRRRFLQSVCAGGLALELAARRLPGGDDGADKALPASARLVVRSEKPLNAEPALEELARDWLTPVESFYIRNHGPTPRFDGASFRLAVEGLVDRQFELSVAELVERFPALRTTATLTCAGNRRSEFSGPKISGVAWGAGAIGNAEWSGVALAAVLRHAGVQSGAKHVWFEGGDEISDKAETYPFGGSIPMEKALAESDGRPTCVLATKMNGKPLTAEHGFPLRGVVPGYIGARSVKWLRKIVVSDRPSPNHYLAQAYKVIDEETPAALEAAAPLYEYAINSAIAVPSAETAVSPGRLKVQGYALPAGAAGCTLKRVEVSIDGGERWIAARIVSPVRDFSWALWSADVTVTEKTETLIVRAVDSSGQTQPREMPWNAKGYQYNAWHQVQLKHN